MPLVSRLAHAQAHVAVHTLSGAGEACGGLRPQSQWTPTAIQAAVLHAADTGDVQQAAGQPPHGALWEVAPLRDLDIYRCGTEASLNGRSVDRLRLEMSYYTQGVTVYGKYGGLLMEPFTHSTGE
jgi:hypothetical protein